MTPQTILTRRQAMRDALILCVLIGLFFLFMLGSRPLSVPDEGRYVEIPREMVVSGDYLTPRLNGVKYFEKPVLFYWLESFAVKLFGIREFFLRLWPALFALAGCLAVYAAGSRLYGRRSGLIASAVLATSVLYYALSRAIILDMPVSALLTIALLSFLAGTHEPAGIKRRLLLWSFYASAALAVLTKGLIGIVIPGMVIGAWIAVLGEWRMLKTIYLPSGLLLFFAIAAPWHILVDRANPEFFNFYFIHEHFQRYLTKVHGRYKPAWFFVPILLAGMFPWTAFLVQAVKFSTPPSWKERHEHRDALFLLLWAGLVFLFFSASDSKLAPYILPVLPPLAIMIGRYLAAAWDSHDMPGLRPGYVVLCIMGVGLAAGLLLAPLYRAEIDWRDLHVYLGVLAFLALGGAFATAILGLIKDIKWAFWALTLSMAAFLAFTNPLGPFLDTRSVKTLAAELKQRLKPGDDVATYGYYYQDLPVYLERRITVVDWKGELEFGATVEDTSAWMIDSTAFWKKWDGPSTIYMLTTRATLESLRAGGRKNLFLISGTWDNVLVANKETKP